MVLNSMEPGSPSEASRPITPKATAILPILGSKRTERKCHSQRAALATGATMRRGYPRESVPAEELVEEVHRLLNL